MEAINIMQDTNNLDIEDYMDVVTTYKCRFCSFTSSAPEGISEHVKQIHIQQPIKPKTETIQINNRKIPINSTLTVDMETGCVQIQQIPQSDSKVKVISEQSAATNFGVLDTIVDQTSASASLQSHDSVTLVTVDQLDEQVANFTGDDNTESSTFNIISIGNQTIGNEEKVDTCLVENLSETNCDVNCDGSTQTNDNNQTDFTLEVQSYESANSPKSTPPITKELFLCGQCSIGYNSIEDCKSHMVEDHNIQIEDPTVGNIKISVGTQVENTGKKPGRKKKSETVPAAENETITIQPLSDSDWEEDKDDYYIGSRSRRKIRRPKALKDDYYLPKRKHIDIDKDKRSYTHLPKTMKMQPVTDKYDEKCSVVGCYAKFKTKESLDIHQKCHADSGTSFLCPHCSHQFQNWRLIRFHLWKAHKVDTDLLECDICHDFRTDAFSKLMIHQEIHSEEKPYTCDVCGKGFRQYSQMKNHQLIHSTDDQNNEKSKGKRQCDTCKRIFANQKCLLKHIEGVHSQIKPYKCMYCGYASSRKAMLLLHERTHTKEKPFKCEVCSFATGDHNSLRRHSMRHTGQRPYRCNYCPYTCIQAISIKMHMKNKHPNAAGVFCCNECTYRTVNEQFFLNHIKDHENGLIQEKEHISNTIHDQSTMQIMNENGIQLQDIIEIQQKSAELDQDRTPLNLQMQVQTLESGETQISADDFAKISSYEDLGSSNISSSQLITYALNAIAQNTTSDTECSSIQIINGIQISVTTAPPKDGVTNHSISFHVPVQNHFHSNGSEVVLEQVNQISEIPVQALSFDDVTESVDEEGNNQANEQQVIMTSQGEIVNLVSTATIEDLAQISCIVKDGIVFETNGSLSEAAS
ncbi:uncharacterized protein LOC143079769 [Mytilus galloprovincialis]|uniref:uncharacterized protein LOC143079769 n=1 Tax=Mytilus galloprovincialis TaxID=29158 RepID=UPI003F7C2633